VTLLPISSQVFQLKSLFAFAICLPVFQWKGSICIFVLYTEVGEIDTPSDPYYSSLIWKYLPLKYAWIHLH
jgi:hypothetical protein